VEARPGLHEVHDLPRLSSANLDQRIVELMVALSASGAVGG
jgi:hypothetical protein